MFKRYFIFALCFIPFLLMAQTTDFEADDEVDMDALRKWIREKRLVTMKELGGDLSISGEVRVEFQAFDETRNGASQRGASNGNNVPKRAYDTEVNLMLDYRTNRTWAAIKLEFDNDMGTESGSTSKIRLEKAYFGGRAVDGDTFTLDVELGRRGLSNIFESKLEFGSLFDGALLRLNKAFESIADFYTNLGVFIINDKDNHYGQVGEIGALDIANTGLYLKYSLVNWKKHHDITSAENLKFNFIVSQGVFAYQFNSKLIHKLVKFYTGFLYNHAAKALSLTNNDRQNLAWYVGVSLGLVRKKGDWALDANFQYQQAQAIPDFDASGIGRGNASRVGLYTTNINGSGALNTRETAVGSGNFRGAELEFLYAITNNLTLLQNAKISYTLDKNIGPNLKYKSYEAEFIYAF